MLLASGRRLRLPVLVGVVLAAAAYGCAQIIGASDDRQPYPVSQAPDAGSAAVPVDTDGCAPGEKRCNGACVPKSIDYGCGSADCSPCSLPNADRIICSDDKCTAATCKPGFGACGEAADGCNADLTSPLTCTNCLTACNVDSGQVCTPSGCGADCGALTNCMGACVDRQTSPQNCGTCGKVCPTQPNGDPGCTAGQCTVTCRPGYAHCDGSPSGPCAALTVFYRDADGDGFGATGTTKLACDQHQAGAGWVTAAGDCHDGNPDVHPTQAQFFGTPFTTTSNRLSYDYDCTGVEAEQAGTVHFATCGPSCTATGYVPAGSGRAGGGVNDYCGSQGQGACYTYISCNTIVYDGGVSNPCH